MPTRPRVVETKIEQTTSAWETLRAAKSFGGMTLAQFKARVKPSLDARAEIAALADQMDAAVKRREQADAISADAIGLAVKGIVGDPAEGDDGELYKAMGYVPKSERRSGLTRKKKPA